MKYLISFLFFMCSSIALSASGTVEFEATGTPGFLRIVGESGKVSGDTIEKDGLTSGVFKVNLSEFKTGMDLRDSHLRDHLETDKFPFAELSLYPVKVEKSFDFLGGLKLHGKIHRVKGHANLKDGEIIAKFKINTDDYGLKEAKHLGIGVDKVVGITVKIRK